MDRAVLERDGVAVRLEPRFMAVLIRLALDLGGNVRVDDLSREVLLPGDGPPVNGFAAKDEARRRRTHVYKCVSALRTALDPDRPGEASVLLLTDPGKNPGYRLELPADSVDLIEFERLLADSRGAPPVREVSLLRRALELWRGRPLVDVEHHEWARRRIQRATAAHDEARRRLLDLYETFGRTDPAIETATALLADHPHDTALRDRLARLSLRRTTGVADLQYRTGSPESLISVRIGDLFDQHDAHLVIGFSDTFETNTADDRLVSRASVQGQLVHRLYDGDHQLLDRELRRARRDAPRKVEARETKRYGKLTRHPVGTVAVLQQGGRRLFALAYSQVDERGLFAQSSVPLLETALDQLWHHVRTHAQHRPVAMAVLGSGLARINDLDRVGLVRLTVRSFLGHNAHGRLTDELRIMILPKDAAALDMNRLDEAVQKTLSAQALSP
ncbi:macro domain-containing protein [Streptomyces lushanensis]|uniref:macro domain-containing protein n=1 Tax=Streptomyces lushanensis TaxID=1434255 RepID=UPI00114D0473|nr:macro domain-containing protein [Streptomyces lushanensis]